MNFGQAIEALKHGKRVVRSGWNGKGMWLGMVKSGEWTFTNGKWGDNLSCLPFIGMKTADDCFVPWLASQTDMLSEDWSIVE